MPNSPRQVSVSQPAAESRVRCEECGAELLDGSQFCLSCGHGAGSGTIPEASATGVPVSRIILRFVIWFFVPFLVLAGWWVSTTVSPVAQQVRDWITPVHTETVTEKTFSVNSRNFASYKFSVPSSTTNVEVSGEFSATGADNQIAVYVLADDAFVTWRSGYSANMLYDSGRVDHGAIEATIPAGAGSYYLVFDNRFSQRTGKTINANVTLRYKKWLPDWLLYLKEKARDLVNAT